MSVTFSLLTKIFLLVLYNFFALVSEEIEEEAFGRIYSNTLAVSGDENFQTWKHVSGNKADTAIHVMVAEIIIIIICYERWFRLGNNFHIFKRKNKNYWINHHFNHFTWCNYKWLAMLW